VLEGLDPSTPELELARLLKDYRTLREQQGIDGDDEHAEADARIDDLRRWIQRHLCPDLGREGAQLRTSSAAASIQSGRKGSGSNALTRGPIQGLHQR
jgi:hypothetical protein